MEQPGVKLRGEQAVSIESRPARSRLKPVILALTPTLLWAAVLVAGFLWWRAGRAPEGKQLNQAAWEATYAERRLPLPPGGPREGYWGARLPPRVPDDRVGWHAPPVHEPGLVEVDERGVQRYIAAAGSKRHVLIIGGSVAFGAYSSSISTTYFNVLGGELERIGTPADLTIVAAGGWKAIQEGRALRVHGPSLQPDLVAFLNGLNDLTVGARSRTFYGHRTPTRDGSKWTLTYHDHDYAQRVADYLEVMSEAAAHARRSAGSETLVVLQPSLLERARRTPLEKTLLRSSLVPHESADALLRSYQAMREGLARLEREGALHFLDCSRIFDGEETTTFSDMWHFSDFGHALLGKAMAARIGSILASPAMPARSEASR